MKLRATARSEPGAAADCLLAALGNEGEANDSDDKTARRYVGALILNDMAENIRNLPTAIGNAVANALAKVLRP